MQPHEHQRQKQLGDKKTISSLFWASGNLPMLYSHVIQKEIIYHRNHSQSGLPTQILYSPRSYRILCSGFIGDKLAGACIPPSWRHKIFCYHIWRFSHRVRWWKQHGAKSLPVLDTSYPSSSHRTDPAVGQGLPFSDTSIQTTCMQIYFPWHRYADQRNLI